MPSNAFRTFTNLVNSRARRISWQQTQKEKKMKLDLLSIGEVTTKIHKDQSGTFSLRFAGDTYNTAIYFACALHYVGSVAYWTLIENDPLSANFMDAEKCEEITISYITNFADRKLGIYVVSNDATGECRFSYYCDGSAATQMYMHHAVEIELPKSK